MRRVDAVAAARVVKEGAEDQEIFAAVKHRQLASDASAAAERRADDERRAAAAADFARFFARAVALDVLNEEAFGALDERVACRAACAAGNCAARTR